MLGFLERFELGLEKLDNKVLLLRKQDGEFENNSM
jgi:hypothetical protein